MSIKRILNFTKSIRLSCQLVVLGVFTTVLILVSGYILHNISRPTYTKDGVIYTQDWKGQIIKKELDLRRVKGKQVKAKVTKDFEVNSWEIVDNSQDPPFPTGINYYNKDRETDVLLWKEYLIGFTKDYFTAKGGGGYLDGSIDRTTLQTTVRHIRILNTKTGEVYSISLQKPSWGEIDYVGGEIIDNYYFLKIGSYGPRSAGFQYRLQLPPSRSSKIEKLEFPIGTIKFRFGEYYLTAYCYEGCSYQRVNRNNLKATELKRLNDAGNTYFEDRPEKLLGFTKNGEMVLEIADTKEIIAVSLLDEKTSRKLPATEEYTEAFTPYKPKNLEEQFESLNLDDKYILVEKLAKYQTSYVKIYDENNLPQNATIIEE